MKNNYVNDNFKSNHFTVAKNQINNTQTLLPYILYKKMEAYAMFSALPYKENIASKPTLSKLNILKNAFLNDQLQLKSTIKKLNKKELVLTIDVFKELNDSKDIICNAIFSFTINGINTNIA